MRILLLSKRQYTGKDLIDDRYGRLYEIPRLLAGRGHSVAAACLSYRTRDVIHRVLDGVEWSSWNLGFPPVGFYRHLNRLESLVESLAPDLVIGSSDVYQIILAHRIAEYAGIPLVVDLYDNFEAFGATRIPGVFPLFRQAIGAAAGVACVSEPLAAKVRGEYGYCGPLRVIGNAVETALFHKLDKGESRKRLGLPPDALLIGTGGALFRNRGIGTLYQAYEELKKQCRDIHLVLAGRAERTVRPPSGPRVHYLGELPYDLMPVFYNALDIAVVCNVESAFGEYCFPQKAYEILACKVPLIGADVGVMKALLADFPENRFVPADVGDLVETIRRHWSSPAPLAIEVQDWGGRAELMEELLMASLGLHG